MKIPIMLMPFNDPLINRRLNYHARLKRLMSHMKEHISEPLQLDGAARIVYMEKTAFSRFFSRAVGITFHEFVQQWRIAIAAESMLNSDASLTEIAFASGFQNMNTFERTFKKLSGLTPSAYRKYILNSQEIKLCQEQVTEKQKLTTQGQEVERTLAND